jgi:hypothetical protein
MTSSIAMNSSEKSHEHHYISSIQSVKMSTKNAIQALEYNVLIASVPDGYQKQ